MNESVCKSFQFCQQGKTTLDTENIVEKKQVKVYLILFRRFYADFVDAVLSIISVGTSWSPPALTQKLPQSWPQLFNLTLPIEGNLEICLIMHH